MVFSSFSPLLFSFPFSNSSLPAPLWEQILSFLLSSPLPTAQKLLFFFPPYVTASPSPQQSFPFPSSSFFFHLHFRASLLPLFEFLFFVPDVLKTKSKEKVSPLKVQIEDYRKNVASSSSTKNRTLDIVSKSQWWTLIWSINMDYLVK